MKTSQHNNFTLIRLVLATLVLFGHYAILPSGGATAGLFIYADLAVDGFFIVSGFLVSGSIDKQPGVIGFYLRRMFRLYPLYAVVVLLQAGVMFALLPAATEGVAGEAAKYLGANLVFANFLAHDMGGLLAGLHNNGINPSLWTLKIEVGFYLILPFLWWCTRRFGGWFLLAVFAASTALTVFALHHEMIDLSRQLPCQLRFFIIGIALYRYGDRIRLSVPQALVAVPVLAYFCQPVTNDVLLVYYPPALGVLLFILAVRLPALPMKLDISYGVYLFHGPLIQLSLLLGYFQDSTEFLLWLMAAVFVLAWAAEKLIERPGIEWGKYCIRHYIKPRKLPDARF